MQILTHGGYCCGRRHIYDMNGETTASIRAFMDRNHLRDDGANKITEIVVSRQNADYEQLKREVVGAGFVLVAEWDNCSGTRCWMYLHANDWNAFPNGAPQQVLLPAAIAAPAPVQVHTTYHNVLRTGRGAGFSSRALALAAAPRAASIDQLVIMSDGTTRWVEGV